MNHLKFLLFFILGSLSSIAQRDSLLTVLSTTNTPQESANIYLQLSQVAYKDGDNELSKSYVIQGLQELSKAQNNLTKAKLTFQLGILEELTDKEEATTIFKKAIQLFEQNNTPQKAIPAYIHLVSLYADLRENKTALAYYETADSLIQPNDWEHQAWLNSTLGRLYFYEEDYPPALRYYQTALNQYQKIDYQSGIGSTLTDIGNIYYSTNQPDSAIAFYQQSLNYITASNHPVQEAITYYNIGDTYFLKADFATALQQFKKAEDICKKLNEKSVLSYALSGQAQAYAATNQFDKAIQKAKDCIKLGKVAGEVGSQQLGLENLIDIYKQQGNFAAAMEISDRYVTLKDSLATSENKRIIAELEQQYQTKEKQAQIELQSSRLARQRNLLLIIGLAAILLLVLAGAAMWIAIQRRKVNAQLRALNTSKSNFFANVSHELRTPLTLILAPLTNAIQSTKNPVIKEDLELAQRNSQQLLGLVNEILDLSKLENEKMTLLPKAVHFQSLLNRIFFAAESATKLRGIQQELDYQLAGDLWLKMDVQKLEKVLNNLISNALKHSETGDFIKMQVLEKENQELQIILSDTGKGITKADLPYIFDRFYQGSSADNQLKGGTGIGLALAKEYAQLMGGDLTVKSTVEKGTTFYLKLPLVKTEASEQLPKTIAMTTPFIHKENPAPLKTQILFAEKPKLLIVEDHPDMSQFLLKTLRPYYRCVTAMNGIDGLEKLEKERFDLVTSDVMMPQMDGFTFLKKIHERELFSHTPVILLTARSLEIDKLRGFQLGVDDYITKPFMPTELIARIDNLLRNKAEREKWQKKHAQSAIESVSTLSANQELLQKAEAIVIEQLNNSNFKVNDLAVTLNYSQRQLERIIKKLTGFTPNNFIKEIRLQKALQLLESQQFATIAEIGYETGFADAAYFSKVFQKRFGKKPSDVHSTGF